MIYQSVLANELLDRKLSGSEFKMVSRLAVYGDKPFVMSEQRIAKITGLSLSTVQRTIPLLEGRGLMYRAICHKDGRRTKSRYRMILPKPKRKRFFCLPVELTAKLSGNMLLVYAYLICKAGRNGEAYPSEYQIAEALGLSRTTVRSCTARLERDGLIGKEHRCYEKKRQTRAYRSFAYVIGAAAEKIDRSERRERAKRRIGKGICLPRSIVWQSANLGLVAGMPQFPPSSSIFRPPRPPDLPP